MSESPGNNADAELTVPPDGKKFFISYSKEDRPVAEKLFRILKKKKIPCWIDKKDISPGEEWPARIVQAIDQSAGLILLLSENSNKSHWVVKEVGQAVNKGKHLFPVRIANVQPSDPLVLHISGSQHVDLLEQPFNREELKRLVDALQNVLQNENKRSQPLNTTGSLTALGPITDFAGTSDTVDQNLQIRQRPQSVAKSSARLRRKSHATTPESFFDRARRFSRKHSVAVKALAFAAACASNWWVDWEVAQNDPASVTAQRLFSVATLYQRVVTAVPRKPQTGNVFLIEISGLPGVSDSNTCKERTYIGDLLRTLALAQPRVVVIDGYFDNNRCDGANDKLVDGAKMLCQANAKLVVGRAVNEDALKKDLPVYPLDEALDFRKAGAACVSEGLVNLDPDFRRVSLWFPNVQAVAYSVPPPPSLPLAAALAYKDDLGVARWPHEADPPYVSFLAPHEFDKFKRNASEVLCGPPEDWRACEDTQIRKDVKNLALGKVVVIGELDHRDKHPTVLGELDGYMLQANYIESLIDNRLFRPVPEWFDWLAGLAIFVCFDYLSWRHQGIHIVAACAMLVAGVLLGVYFALHIVGFYVNPALVIILTILYSRVIGFFLGKR